MKKSENNCRKKYFGDTIYDVWMAGGNPDAVADDDVYEDYYNGVEQEDCVRHQLRMQKRKKTR